MAVIKGILGVQTIAHLRPCGAAKLAADRFLRLRSHVGSSHCSALVIDEPRIIRNIISL